eukprot:TRINITY_DN3236_c0_g1_i2.p1 TRINITY_DN3236_c0_g1~~TRINITY_DN3236_c0_g1_i2.p1  ORF type:complete len:595 (+),score=187.50 TRINITY_DN3236_c0_g1_i2:87-1787(+)
MPYRPDSPGEQDPLGASGNVKTPVSWGPSPLIGAAAQLRPPEHVKTASPHDALLAPGGDVTYPIYKALGAQQEDDQRPRARTQKVPSLGAPFGEDIKHMRKQLSMPQGFRRWHVARSRTGFGGMQFDRAFIHLLYDDLAGLSDSDEDLAAAEPGQVEEGGLSDSEAFFSMLKGIIGSGILLLPSAYARAGLSFALGAQIFVGLLSGYCILLLVRAQGGEPRSFSQLGYSAIGPCGAGMVSTCVVAFQAGLLIMYQIFVGQTVKATLEGFSNCAPWATGTSITTIITVHTCFQILVAWIRRMRWLAWIAIGADVFLIAGLGLILYSAWARIAEEGPRPHDQLLLGGAGMYFGTAVTSFEGIAVMLPVADAMRNPGHFDKVLALALGCCMFLYGTIGASGYLAYGEKVRPNVLVSIGSLTTLAQTVGALYCVAIICSLPLQALPAFRVTEAALGIPSGKRNPKAKWLKNLVRSVTIVLSAAAGVTFADTLGPLMTLVGALAGAPLSFVFPPLFHLILSHRRKEATAWTRNRDLLLVALGTGLSGYATIIGLLNWSSGSGEGTSAAVCG